VKGHGEKLERKQELAIVALLQQPPVEEAATAVGVAPVTLWRWLQQPDFGEQYRAARRQVLEHAVTQLQQAASEAVGTLTRNLTCGVPSVEVRAAQAILDQAARGLEVLDLEARIAALEQAAADQGNGRRPAWPA
jgi:hypothetical protein